MSPIPPIRQARATAFVAALACILAACGIGSTATSDAGATGSAPASASPLGSPPGASGTHAPGPSPMTSATPAGATTTAGLASTAPASPITVTLAGRLAILLAAPDGARLLAVGGSGQVVAITRPPTGVSTVAANRLGRLAAAAPDGRFWVADGLLGATLEWAGLQLKTPLPGGLPGPVVGLTWNPDGAGLLGLAEDLGGGEQRIAMLEIGADARTVHVAEVRATPGGPRAWALADGRQLIIARTRADESVIALIDGGRVQLTAVTAVDVALSGDRSTAALLLPDGSVRVAPTPDVLAEREGGWLLPAPAGMAATGIALDVTGAQLAVVWLPTNGTDGVVVAYGVTGQGWREALNVPLPAGTTSATPAWLP